VTDRRAANAARVRTLTVGLAVAGVVGTGALGGLAWAQGQSGEADSSGTSPDTSGTASTGSGSSDSVGSGSTGSRSEDFSNSGVSGSGTTFPQLRSGSGSSHTRTAGS
jgi:hypothetical protein